MIDEGLRLRTEAKQTLKDGKHLEHSGARQQARGDARAANITAGVAAAATAAGSTAVTGVKLVLDTDIGSSDTAGLEHIKADIATAAGRYLWTDPWPT